MYFLRVVECCSLHGMFCTFFQGRQFRQQTELLRVYRNFVSVPDTDRSAS